MKPARLSFGYTPDSPSVEEEGIVLAAGDPQGPDTPVTIHGCCKIGKAHLPSDQTGMPAGIFVTAIELFGQRPVAANLVREHIVLADDVIDTGDSWVTYFKFDLFKTLGIAAVPFTFIVHAACWRHVSNFLWIEPADAKVK
jgi:hypothetical protein